MLKSFLLDLIFPRFCLSCKKELGHESASFICDACLNKISLNGVCCHICGLRNKNGVCQKCRKKTLLKGLFAAGKYRDPILREAIHRFKYKSIKSLKKPLAELVVRYLKKENLIEKFQLLEARFPTFPIVLVPIPLTTLRKLKRGFNQSELLAEELSQILNCPVVNLLKRKKFGAPQARIKDWQTRKENISGAFCLSTSYPQNYRFRKSIVVLVDDVTTSGATLEEAARVLKEVGAKEIYGLVVAKG